MKNIFKIIFTITITTLLFSCSDEDPIIYNGTEGANRTFLSFPGNTFTLPVAIDATGSVGITLNSSTKSAIERTFSIELDVAETTANPLTYTLPSTVTIPADSYQGTLTIDGADNNLVDNNVTQIIFSLANLPSNVDIDENKIQVNVIEVCPIPEDYMMGDYMIVDVAATVGPDNGTENFAAGIINITANTPTSRSFTAGILPAFAGDREVTMDLVCNSIVLNDVDPNLTCDSGANSYIYTSAGANNSLYDLNSDLTFTINYIEDPQGSCGGPFNSSFMITKL